MLKRQESGINILFEQHHNEDRYRDRLNEPRRGERERLNGNNWGEVKCPNLWLVKPPRATPLESQRLTYIAELRVLPEAGIFI